MIGWGNMLKVKKLCSLLRLILAYGYPDTSMRYDDISRQGWIVVSEA